jgi:purine-nucleoside phosphorylase
VGQQVLIGDHLNLTGGSPLWGASSFLDLGDLYSARLRAAIVEAVPGLAEGVYAGVSGPQYETPAEIRMLRLLGADLVGMSTVHEAIAARHAGAEVVALSLVTNAAAGTAEGPLHHEEIIAAAGAATSRMAETVTTILRVVGA